MDNGRKRTIRYAAGLTAIALFCALSLALFLTDGFLAGVVPAGMRYAIAMLSAVISLVIVFVLAISLIVEKSGIFTEAVIDHVTKAYNVRYFQDKLGVELDNAKRKSETLCLALVDVDDFRSFNNKYGHQTGDKVLAGIVDNIRRQVRRTDIVCRTGGDEFAIIMPDTRLLDSQNLLRRVHDSMGLDIEGMEVKVRLSCGIASYPYHAREGDMLYKLADDAMYWAKYHGKDQVTIFDFASMESFNGEERMRKAAELAYHNTAQTLAIALDERDERTKDHATNVATLAEIFASRLTLSRHKIDMIRMAAMVHDIGKLGMMSLANKEPDELTEEEKVYLQQHPILCHEILTATDLGVVVPWVAAHHERWDGGGYPNGLEGQQIPYESRIIALCDVYENLTGQRRRGVPLSHNEAMAQIIRERGRRFDPDLTDSFVHLMNLLNQMAYDEPVSRLALSDDPIEIKPGTESFYTLVRAKLR